MSETLTEKWCWGCDRTLPVDSFWRDASRYDGLQGACRACKKASEHTYRAANRDVLNPRQRARRRQVKYGLSADDIAARVEAQGGCAACGLLDAKWQVDHDHACCSSRVTCGECVRGILCPGCNSALGHVGDSIERLQSLIAYLARTRTETS